MLNIPGDEVPDYGDFVYFASVIGTSESPKASRKKNWLIAARSTGLI
jgi:hypothetical protein